MSDQSHPPPAISTPTRLAWSEQITNPTRVASTEGSRILLRTPPLTAQSAKLLQKIIFTIRSHDQGWSSYPENHGTFDNSWTWFDAAVMSPNAEDEESVHEECDDAIIRAEDLDSPNVRRHRIQVNKHAVRQAEEYSIIMYPGQEILDGLKAGDQILLVACAQYSGWVNTIEDAKMEVWEDAGVNE